ncbi:hypothetical protein D3C83_33850 [compost metagenome]
MAAVLWLAAGSSAEWLASDALQRALRLSWVVIAGTATYFGTLWMLGFRPADFAKRV